MLLCPGNDGSMNVTVCLSLCFSLSLSHTHSGDVSGDGGCVGHPLEQCGRPGLAAPGRGARWATVLGVLLPGAGLRRGVDPGGPLRAAELLPARRMLHHLPAPAPRGVPRPAAAAQQEHRAQAAETAACYIQPQGHAQGEIENTHTHCYFLHVFFFFQFESVFPFLFLTRPFCFSTARL